MELHLLESDFDLKKYAELARKFTRHDISYHYFRYGKVHGFFDKGKMIGGLALVTGNLLSIRAIPEHARYSSGVENIPRHHIVELHAFWLPEELPESANTLKFWEPIFNGGLTEYQWMIVSYNPSIKELADFFDPIKFITLWPGKNFKGEGHSRLTVGLKSVGSFEMKLRIQLFTRLIKASLPFQKL